MTIFQKSIDQSLSREEEISELHRKSNSAERAERHTETEQVQLHVQYSLTLHKGIKDRTDLSDTSGCPPRSPSSLINLNISRSLQRWLLEIMASRSFQQFFSLIVWWGTTRICFALVASTYCCASPPGSQQVEDLRDRNDTETNRHEGRVILSLKKCAFFIRVSAVTWWRTSQPHSSFYWTTIYFDFGLGPWKQKENLTI